MPAFEYLALDSAGRSHKGVLQADTARGARANLRERGLNPLRIDPVSEGAGTTRPMGFSRGGLSGAQLALLTRQLATLVASGLPIDEALQALAEGGEGRVRTEVVSLRARVMEGASLAAAMAEFPASFPSIFRASVAAGESAGKLDRVLLRLADYAETRDALRRKVLLALTYPILLTVVAVAVVTGLMIWVVPQVIGVFLQYEQALPWPTRVLIAVSGAAREVALPLGAILVIAVLLGAWALRRETVRARLHATLLQLPLLGRLLRATETVRFARTLALLVGSAVPLLESLSIAAQVVENRALREALARVALRVREGQGFSRALADSREFPPVAVRLIASGEKSGRLDEMLFEAAAHQERELDTALGVAMAALGPGVILAVGGLVLFIVLAILLPIFELNSLIR
ncbi:MAG: type II secretion system inner membrane protein GspF [Chiayiivirga sp.]|jgi:general secretion pathway protein F|uniref:type II secretion system inner membrane protein GspF n=1 Tax=Chiayiivirga sp. TaxID=2041042 RepID=UPI0025BBEA4C|nr:type II secretion system inner membrane protein GspF [Chiayiivirga sp.]MCI1730559.1 type II secretion system inner membrane protein GspF [Chiayiivirga sp.]